MDPHHCFDPISFPGPWFSSCSAERRFPPTWVSSSTLGVLEGQYDVVSSYSITHRDMGTHIFSDGSILPKQHSLSVLKQMFEACLRFVFTKTLIISCASRTNLQEQFNFLSGHYQGQCRGTKPRDATKTEGFECPFSHSCKQKLKYLFSL